MSINVQSGAYFEGEASGVLQALEVLFGEDFDKNLLARRYYETLKKIGKPNDTAKYWCEFYGLTLPEDAT